MGSLWLQRKTPKGKWIIDSCRLGSISGDEAEAVLKRLRDLNPGVEFRLMPPTQPKTAEELAEERFKETHTTPGPEGRFIFTDE